MRAERPLFRIRRCKRARKIRIRVPDKLAVLCLRNHRMLREVLLVRARARCRGLRCLVDICVTNAERVREPRARMDDVTLSVAYLPVVATLRPGRGVLYHRGAVKIFNNVWFRTRSGERLTFDRGVLFLKRKKKKSELKKEEVAMNLVKNLLATRFPGVERVEFRDGEIIVLFDAASQMGADTVRRLMLLLPEAEREDMEYNIAMASVIDNPRAETYGFVNSKRFGNCLESEDTPVPYGRLVVYAAWLLSLVYDQPIGKFTRLASREPPFDRLDMQKIVEEGGGGEIASGVESQMANHWIGALNRLMKSKKVKSMNSDLHANVAQSFRRYSIQYRQGLSANVDAFARDLSESDHRFLETELVPEKTFELLFYLKDLISLRADTGIIQSMYVMNVVVGMFFDLGLTKDMIQGLECPVECVRKIALCLDSRELRARAPYSFKPSELRKLDLYAMHHLVKDENWIDLCSALSRDVKDHDPERLDNIYKLFLRTEANADTRPFYVVYLASIFERGRMKAANSPTPKHNGSQRRAELSCFGKMLDNFTNHVVQVTGRTEFDTPISQDNLTDFMRIHETDMYEMLNVITNENLLAACGGE